MFPDMPSLECITSSKIWLLINNIESFKKAIPNDERKPLALFPLHLSSIPLKNISDY